LRCAKKFNPGNLKRVLGMTCPGAQSCPVQGGHALNMLTFVHLIIKLNELKQ
jgi:hypothetical protein